MKTDSEYLYMTYRCADRCEVIVRRGVDELKSVSLRVAFDMGHDHLHGLERQWSVLKLEVGPECKEYVLFAVAVSWCHLRHASGDYARCELHRAAVAVFSTC